MNKEHLPFYNGREEFSPSLLPTLSLIRLWA